MRFLFFLLLKLIEIAGVLVITFTICGIMYLCKLLPWLAYILGIGAVLFLLFAWVYVNWMGSGDWADKWRKRKADKELQKAHDWNKESYEAGIKRTGANEP